MSARRIPRSNLPVVTGVVGGVSPSAPSRIVVDAAGNAFFTVSSSSGTAILGCVEGDPTLVSSGSAQHLLVKIAPDGTTTQTSLPINVPLQSTNGLTVLAPDGNGGALVQWITGQYPSTSAYIMATSTGATYPSPVAGGIFQIVFGENTTAFASDGFSAVAFNSVSGRVSWTYQAQAQGTLSIITSTDGGGLVVKFSDQSGSDTVIRFDSSGNPTPDTWTVTSASNMGAPALTNVGFFASDAFLATTVGSGQPLLAQSDGTIDYPSDVGWTSEPDDNKEKSIHITLNVYQVQGTTVNSNDSIQSQVTKAQNIWGKKIQGLHLDWNPNIPTQIPGCAPGRDCVKFPQADLTTYFNPTTCQSDVAWQALNIRYPFKPGPENTGLKAFFTNTITDVPPDFSVPIETVPLWNLDDPSCFPPTKAHLAGNDIVMSNQAFGNVLAHAIGHVFGLGDLSGAQAVGPVGNADGNNLMCGGNDPSCPTGSPESYLTSDQIATARKGLQIWKPK